MIAAISGNVLLRRPDHVVIDCAGVGYHVAISAQTFQHVPAVDRHISLHTHLVVRDDSLSLYGFATEQERELFLLLLGVPSVGPKLALAILGSGSVRDLFSAVAAGDIDRLKAVSGVGKRTAERIVVELRQRLEGFAQVGTSSVAVPNDARSTARAGLAGLGFTVSEVDKLLDTADGDSAEELIADALRKARQ